MATWADPIPPVDLASLAAAGAIQGRGGGWTERTCRPTWSGSAGVIASSPTATTRSRCWWWSSQAEASWPLTARFTSSPRWSSLTCPRGRSERSRPLTGRWRTCRSTAAGRRNCRWVGTPSDPEVPRGKPRRGQRVPIHPLELDGGRGTIQLRETPGNLSGSGSGTHQDFSPADANCCHSLLLDPDARIGIDLHKRLFLLVSGRGE
jgi:hypothetical protein